MVIAGVTCYAVDAVISDVRKNSKYYYKAYRRLNTVFINQLLYQKLKHLIELGQALIHTYTQSLARKIVVSAGLGVVGPENHWAWYKIGSYFSHFHTGNRNGAHSFYGLPK